MVCGQVVMHIRTLLLALLGILAVHSVIIANADEARKTLPLPEIPSISLIQDDLSLFQIETVSIASRYEQPVSKAPGNVSVITAEDIRHSGAIDIPIPVRRVPGMEVRQTIAAECN